MVLSKGRDKHFQINKFHSMLGPKHYGEETDQARGNWECCRVGVRVGLTEKVQFEQRFEGKKK